MKTTEIKEIGNVFNNLRVISYAGKNKHNKKLVFVSVYYVELRKI